MKFSTFSSIPLRLQLQLAYQSCPAVLSVSEPVAQSHQHILQFELHSLLFEVSKTFNTFLIETLAVQLIKFAYKSSLLYLTPVACRVCVNWSSLRGRIPSNIL